MTDTEKPSAPQGFKTFIGNLAYATTEDGLKQTFSTYGKVLNSVIIKRRGRSLGYGFVDFETKDQAEKAVASLNGSELDSRKINVELAKPREQQTQQQQQSKPRAPRTQNKRRPVRQNEAKKEVKATEEPEQQNEDGFVEKVGRRRQKQQKQQAAAKQQQQPKPAISQPPRQRKPTQQPAAPAASTSAAPQTARKRTTRKKRTPRPAGDVPTEAGLFVANIPYNLDEEQFKKIFEEKGFTVVKHRVVKLPNGKSLGYGFVDLKDSEEQKKAVESLNNTQVGGREISVKVAMVKPETETAAAPKSE